VDGTADKNRRKEPLFPLLIMNSSKDAYKTSQDRSNSVPTASPGQVQQKKSLAATLIETISVAANDIARCYTY
jgi:hypothetical protein